MGCQPPRRPVKPGVQQPVWLIRAPPGAEQPDAWPSGRQSEPGPSGLGRLGDSNKGLDVRLSGHPRLLSQLEDTSPRSTANIMWKTCRAQGFCSKEPTSFRLRTSFRKEVFLTNLSIGRSHTADPPCTARNRHEMELSWHSGIGGSPEEEQSDPQRDQKLQGL